MKWKVLSLALALALIACSPQVQVESARSVVEHPNVVRVVARDSVPGELKILILNLGDEELVVLYDEIQIEAHFGKFKRAAPTGAKYTVPRQGSRLLTLRFSAEGLRPGDAITVSFDGAIFFGQKAARLNPLEYMVKNKT